MTRQQLIDLVINAKRTAPENGSFMEYLADFLIGYGVTLAPTREQVERLRGEWEWVGTCRDNQGIKWWACSKCGIRQRIGDYATFCPACGAPMTDEAVEIIMRRLEAMKDVN